MEHNRFASHHNEQRCQSCIQTSRSEKGSLNISFHAHEKLLIGRVSVAGGEHSAREKKALHRRTSGGCHKCDSSSCGSREEEFFVSDKHEMNYDAKVEQARALIYVAGVSDEKF